MITHRLLPLLAVGLLSWTAAAQSSFTYQGRLTENGSAATGAHDFEFRLFSAAAGGLQVGSVLARPDVNVANGLFTVMLDFGADAFPGADRHLAISVRPGASAGAFSALTPRQQLTPAPYAITAVNFSGAVNSSQLSGAYANPVTFNNAANSFAGSGAGLTGVNAGQLNGQPGSFYQNAANLTGTLPPAVLPGPVAFTDASQTFSGIPAFNGGTSGASAPFSVDSTEVVTGLNADLLDGQSGPFFQDAGNLNAGTLAPGRIADGSIAGSKLAANTVGSDQLADILELGNAAGATGRLTIYRTSASTPGILLEGSSGSIITYGNDGLEQTRLFNGIWGELQLRDETDNNVTVLLTATANSGGQLFLRSPTGLNRLYLYGDFGGTARIGIGRSPAANALEVEGNASKTASGSWLANSDRRIKEAIRPLTNALETLNRVRPVGFRYTDEYLAAHPTIQDTEYFNVVAQEFATVFPDSVQPGGDQLADGNQVLQVDTYPATIYSIAAIQELDRELKARDARIAALEQTVADLAALVKGLQESADR